MTRILITNDDGYSAEGVRELVRAVSPWAETVVVVPDREQSGTGHSITLHRPLRIRELGAVDVGGAWHLVDGTPTDCVNLALHSVMASALPDLVVSGINVGLNLGDDVGYSGTVGGALEGHMLGVPSIALSQEMSDDVDFAATASRACDLLRGLLGQGLTKDLLLNINFPAGPVAGTSVTKLGRRVYREVVVQKTDPRGKAYYWLAGKPDFDGSPGSDSEAIGQGRVSITPLQTDLTDLKKQQTTRNLVENLEINRIPG